MNPTGTAGDLDAIRAAEGRIAERLAVAERTDDEVAAARADAARRVADAAAEAAELAQAESERIDAACRDRIAEEEAQGAARAEKLRAIAGRRMSRDVAAVLAVIMPERPESVVTEGYR